MEEPTQNPSIAEWLVLMEAWAGVLALGDARGGGEDRLRSAEDRLRSALVAFEN